MEFARVYLDAASGQPWRVGDQVLSAAAGYTWATGSAFHSEASRTRAMTATAIESLASLLEVPIQNVVPVHNLGNAWALASESLHGSVAMSPLSRLGAMDSVRRCASDVRMLTVDGDGYLVPEPEVPADWLVIQAGNQEIGSIDDTNFAESSKLLLDATEWVGRVAYIPRGDVLVLRASSWGGPQSVCFVVYRSSAPSLAARRLSMLAPEPALLAIAIAALEQCGDVNARAESHSKALRLLAGELATIKDVTVHGTFERPRLPHILAFSVEGIDAEAMAHALDARGYAVGAGSACIGELGQPSHVLAAIGSSGHGAVRLSLPIDTAPEQQIGRAHV